MREVAPEFETLYQEIADCPSCPLARTRSRTVPGCGPASAEIVFIGEAPGQREDEQGLPFVGPAGRFLDELLASVGLSRETVYICNVVKCRPPGNRDPQPEEIAACRSFLDRQIEIIDPKVIVTLGRFSMARWFSGSTISRVHGRPKRVDGRIVVPMYHPAAALHRGDLRDVIMADFARLPALVNEARSAPPAMAPAAAAVTSIAVASERAGSPHPPAPPAATQPSPASSQGRLL